MVAILALISSILFTPAFTISYFYETGVKNAQRAVAILPGSGYNKAIALSAAGLEGGALHGNC